MPKPAILSLDFKHFKDRIDRRAMNQPFIELGSR